MPFFVVAVPDKSAFSIDKYKSYVCGEIDRFDLYRANFILIHEIIEMVEERGRSDTMLYYYIDPKGDLNHGLMELQIDKYIRQFYG